MAPSMRTVPTSALMMSYGSFPSTTIAPTTRPSCFIGTTSRSRRTEWFRPARRSVPNGPAPASSQAWAWSSVSTRRPATKQRPADPARSNARTTRSARTRLRTDVPFHERRAAAARDLQRVRTDALGETFDRALGLKELGRVDQHVRLADLALGLALRMDQIRELRGVDGRPGQPVADLLLADLETRSRRRAQRGSIPRTSSSIGATARVRTAPSTDLSLSHGLPSGSSALELHQVLRSRPLDPRHPGVEA